MPALLLDDTNNTSSFIDDTVHKILHSIPVISLDCKMVTVYSLDDTVITSFSHWTIQ